jgi:hypothetical protein
MLIVETIGKIRRAYFVQGKAIKAICRELRVSRKVVRKVVRSGATEFRYERGQQPLPKMGPWKEELARLLAANEARPARERLTLVRIFEELAHPGLPRWLRHGAASRQDLAPATRGGDGGGIRSAELRAR